MKPSVHPLEWHSVESISAVVQHDAEVARKYADLSRGALVDLVRTRDKSLEDAQAAANEARRKLAKSERRVVELQQEVRSCRHDALTIVEHVEYRRGMRVIRPFAGYHLALRRNMSGSVSREAVVAMLAGDYIQGQLK